MRQFRIALIFIFLAFLTAPLFAEASDPPAVGEAFGKPILKEEFNFALKTTGIFNVSTQEPGNDQERRNEVWKHITFLREATKRGIKASQEEVAQEMTRLLAEKNIAYGSYNYHEFVKTSFQEDSTVFEKRVRDLLTVKKMLDTILHPAAPKITDQDAKQKFLNQYNSMATEFVRYPTLAEAQTFYKGISKKKWDSQKTADKKWCTPTGHISLEALIDLWQVPTEDAYRMHGMELGKIGAPAKMVNGYGVFRMIEKKSANLKDYTEAKKKEYLKVLEQVYYYNNTQKVIETIVKDASLKDYARDKFVALETSQGTIELALFTTIAPKACENFMGLIEKKYYDGLLFHRIIKGFMIQGGDPTGTGSGGESIWGKPFEDEVNKDVQFEKGGILAMANSGPATNGSQFFITLAPTPHLNMKHTIFGQIANGYDVLKKLGDSETGEQDRPKVDQKIVKMTLKKWPTSLTF